MTGGAVDGRLEALNGVVETLLAAESEPAVCERAVDAVPSLFDAEVCGLWLSESDGQRLQLAASSDGASDAFDATALVPGDGSEWDVFERGETRYWNRVGADSSVVHGRSRVASELVASLGEYGIVTVGSTRPAAFDDDDREVARLLATTIEAALRNADREHTLRLKNQRLEEFVGIVSHDLRNPLNVATASLEELRGECDSEHVDGVHEAVSRIDALVEDLLVLAEEGYVVTERSALDLATLAERAWGTVDTGNATLETDGTTTVFGDASRLRQVFENLFRNAVEHGGDDVRVRVAPIEPFHTTTRVDAAAAPDGFYVEDDGRGVPEHLEESVFERGHSTGGTGLGLAIVDRIVSAHGWAIACEESPRGGARFAITGEARSVTPFEAF